MDLEPATGTGTSASALASAHHRVCSRHGKGSLTGCYASSPTRRVRSRLWVWPTYRSHPPRKTGRFTGADFPLQPDGTLRCPAGQSLVPQERRREADSSLRVVYAASIRNCRPCRLRKPRQWNGNATKKPRQVSVLLHPLAVGREPLLWQDWSRREHRRACIHLIRSQRVEIEVQRGVGPPTGAPHVTSAPLSRAERAHTRLSWVQRLVRNAHPQTTRQITIRLFGVPAGFATSLSLASG